MKDRVLAGVDQAGPLGGLPRGIVKFKPQHSRKNLPRINTDNTDQERLPKLPKSPELPRLKINS
jgi:hypothetical protein